MRAGLRLGGRVIFLQRNRAGAGVLGNLKALAGQLLSRAGEHELVVVPAHALDFDQLLLAHVLEHQVDDGQRYADRAAETGHAARILRSPCGAA